MLFVYLISMEFDTLQVGNKLYSVIGYYRPFVRKDGRTTRGPEDKTKIEMKDKKGNIVVMEYPFLFYRALTPFKATKDGIDVTHKVKTIF